MFLTYLLVVRRDYSCSTFPDRSSTTTPYSVNVKIEGREIGLSRALERAVLPLPLNPSPGNGFFATFAGNGGVKWPPRHISSSRAHSNKIPTATPMFSGSVYLMVVLPISWEVDVCSKSKMAAKLPEVPITMMVLQIHMSFQKQYRGL